MKEIWNEHYLATFTPFDQSPLNFTHTCMFSYTAGRGIGGRRGGQKAEEENERGEIVTGVNNRVRGGRKCKGKGTGGDGVGAGEQREGKGGD